MDPPLEYVFRWWRICKIKTYIKGGASLCDIGCGKDAKFLFSIKHLIKRGVGLDQEVEDKKIENIILKRTKIKKRIPVKDQQFDFVTLLAVIEHLDYPLDILQETYRATKENGHAIITTPDPKSKKLLEFLTRIGLVSKKEISDHKNYFTVKELEKLLLEIGFSEVVTRPFEFGYNNLIVAFK